MALPTTLRIGDIVVHITSIQNDIDEEDRDAILIGIVVQNGSKQDVTGVSLSIETSGATTCVFKELPANIPSGASNEAMYFLPIDCGAWILSVNHAGLRGELGPFPDGHRHLSEAPSLSEISTSTSTGNSNAAGDAFADAFQSALSGFGSNMTADAAIVIDGDDPLAVAFMNSGAAQLRKSTPDIMQQKPVNQSETSISSPPPPPPESPTDSPQQSVPESSKESEQEARSIGPAIGSGPMGPPQGPPMGSGPMGPPQGPPMGSGPMGPPQGPPMGSGPMGPPQGPPMGSGPMGPPQGPPMRQSKDDESES